MIVYIGMLIISLVFAIFASKTDKKRNQILFMVLSFIPFFLVSAIRYNVGTDYWYRYVPNYKTIANGGTVASLEPFFHILIKICCAISKDYVILFIITSAIIIGLIFKTIYQNSKCIWMSVLIFFIGCFFFQSLNLIRQFISMSILFSSYKLLLSDKKKDWLLWILCVCVASLFHTVSLVFLLLLIVKNKKINTKVLFLIAVILLFVGGKIPLIAIEIIKSLHLNYFTNVDKYIHYIKFTGNLPLSILIVEICTYAFCNIMYNNFLKKTGNVNKEAIFFINCQSISFLFTIMNIHIELFFRLSLIFSIFQILSIPYFFMINKNDNIKLFKFNIKNGTKLLTACILVLLSARMVYSNFIKGADQILPYKTIFNRDGV